MSNVKTLNKTDSLGLFKGVLKIPDIYQITVIEFCINKKEINMVPSNQCK